MTQEAIARRPRKALIKVPVDDLLVAAKIPVALKATTPEELAAELHDELVLVTIPKGFTLTDDGHHTFRYEAGPGKMPRTHAEHWYAKKQGVTIFKS